MSQRGLAAVLLVGSHPLHLRLVPLPLCKAVGHEHVEHVAVVEAYALVASHLALFQLVLHLDLVELEGHGAGLGLAQVEIDEEVVGRVEAHHTVDDHAGIVGSHTLHGSNVLAIDHQLHLGVLEPYKPVGGVNAINHYFAFGCTHCHYLCHKGHQEK